MKSISEVYVVQTAVAMMRDGRINLDHFLQRESFQWSTKQQIRLIDTLLRGYPFPAIYAIKERADSDDLTILDGKQRFLTLKAFILDQIFAFKCSEPVTVNGQEYNVNGLKFRDMPEPVRNKILDANFNVISFTGYDVDDIYEIFDRLNNGTPLTKAEKCKPLMGNNMILRFRRIMESGFFEKTGMTAVQLRKGNGYMVLIHCLMLMLCGGETGLSSSRTSRFLAEYSARLTDADYEALERSIEWLSELTNGINVEHCRVTLTKVSIAPIVYVLHVLAGDAAALARFRTKLTIFLNREELPARYLALCTKSTDKAQVGKRVRFFMDMAQPAPEQSFADSAETDGAVETADAAENVAAIEAGDASEIDAATGADDSAEYDAADASCAEASEVAVGTAYAAENAETVESEPEQE